MNDLREIRINLGVDPSNPCPDWDRDKSSVTDADGNEVGFIDSNDGMIVTLFLRAEAT